LTFIAPNVEDEILTQLIYNEAFARNVTPYLKREYFEDPSIRIIFEEYDAYLKEYGAPPTKEAILLETETRSNLTQEELSCVFEKISQIAEFGEATPPDLKWLMDTTESYCQDRSVYLAVTEAISILEGEDSNSSKHAIPEILSNALATSFDERIGHEYLTDVESRWDFYNRKEERMEFNLKWFNDITDGGIPKKTLTCLLAPTNAGKTLVKTFLASEFLMKGRNVLYITMEMAEERISERIDANLLGIDISDLKGLPRDTFTNRLSKIKEKTQGRLFVKEYPTAGAHVGHFRHLLSELKIKEKFIPDVIFIDYLNICASSRIKGGDNTYVLVKSIAEEMRGLAVEQDVAIITSTQTNRSGWGSSDLELSDTSESAGLPATVDLFIGIIVTEELTEMGQIMFKQLKNRFTDVTTRVRKIFNIDRPKMRISECEDSSFTSDTNKTVDISIGRDSNSSNGDPFSKFKI